MWFDIARKTANAHTAIARYVSFSKASLSLSALETTDTSERTSSSKITKRSDGKKNPIMNALSASFGSVESMGRFVH
jgi:hypothetical protein